MTYFSNQCVRSSPGRVYVDVSLISSAGEGLFSKIAAEARTVMSFYNGVRITHQEVKERKKSVSIFIAPSEML